VFITLVLLALLFTQINLGDIINTLKSINPIYLIAGFILYTCSYLFRAWRFHILLNKEVGIKELFLVVCVQNMMNNILPARIGELSYIYIIKKIYSTPSTQGIATLFISRLFDIISLGLLLSISFIFISNTIFINQFFFLLVVSLIFIVFLILILTLFYGNFFLYYFLNFLRRYNLYNLSYILFLVKKCEELINYFEAIKNNCKLLFVMVISTIIWICLFSMSYLMMLAMNIDVTLNVVILGSSIALFTTLLPISGVGGYGTYEAGWTIGFVSLGLSKESAITSGFIAHSLGLIFGIILGISGYLLLINKKV